MATVMTEELVSDVCKKKGAYRTPSLNLQLHLHFQGFSRIQNLEAFSAARVLWLENNIIETIENLSSLPDLCELHLHNNRLRQIGSADGALPALEILHVSHNFISSLAGIGDSYPALTVLIAEGNEIASPVTGLAGCANLVNADLSHNRLSDFDELLATVTRLPLLRSLKLHGNPLAMRTPNYRKRVLSALPELAYLDDMPVFDDERRTADAWGRGGAEAERKERDLIRREKEEKRVARLENFEEVIRTAKENPIVGDTEYFLENQEGEEKEPAEETEDEKRRRQMLQRLSMAKKLKCAAEDDEDDLYIPETQ